MTKLLQAPLYAVSQEWEHNGYHDSDFYIVAFNPNSGELLRYETGSTRYGSRCWTGSEFVPMAQTPESVWQEAQRVYANMVFNSLKRADERAKLMPDVCDIKHGLWLELSRNVRHKGAVYAAGTRGEMNWSGNYGTFYRNGYKKPNRENTRVGLRLLDGKTIFVALSACKQCAPLLTDAELRAKAEDIAKKRYFYAAFRTSAVSMV